MLLKEQSKSFKNRDHTNMAIYCNYSNKNVERTSTVRVSPETSTCEVLRDVSRKLQLTLCAIIAS